LSQTGSAKWEKKAIAIAIPRCELTWFHIESIARVSTCAIPSKRRRHCNCNCARLSRHQPCWTLSGNIRARSVWWPFNLWQKQLNSTKLRV
jgi:hypothetical protein